MNDCLQARTTPRGVNIDKQFRRLANWFVVLICDQLKLCRLQMAAVKTSKIPCFSTANENVVEFGQHTIS